MLKKKKSKPRNKHSDPADPLTGPVSRPQRHNAHHVFPIFLHPLAHLQSDCTPASSPNCIFLGHHQHQRLRLLIFTVYGRSCRSVLSSLPCASGPLSLLGFILSKHYLAACHVSRVLLMILHASLCKCDCLSPMPMISLHCPRGKDTWRSFLRSPRWFFRREEPALTYPSI